MYLFQIDKLTESFDVIADLLKYHHHSNSPFDLEESEHQGPGDLIQHRLVYVGISIFMTKLLKALVPVEKVRYKQGAQRRMVLVVNYLYF